MRNGQGSFWKQSPHHRIPGVASGIQPCRCHGITANADGDMGRNGSFQLLDALPGGGGLLGYPRNLDRGDIGQRGDAPMELVGKGEAGGPRVVVDAQQYGELSTNIPVKSVDLLFGERLVRHGCKQDPVRPRRLGILGESQYIPRAQRADTDHYRYAPGMRDSQPCYTSSFRMGKVGVIPGGTQDTNGIDPGSGQSLDQPSESSFVDAILLNRCQGKGA